MISRRALFGLGAGAAAAAAVVPAKADLEVIVGMDFGKYPSAAVYFTELELEVDLRDTGPATA